MALPINFCQYLSPVSSVASDFLYVMKRKCLYLARGREIRRNSLYGFFQTYSRSNMTGTFDQPVSSMPSPLTRYQEKIQNNEITFDRKQQDALAALEKLYHQLSETDNRRSSRKLGVYMWGSVGRGKTFLMDLFYSSLPKGMALRLHFHHFMARLHTKLNLLSGQTDPLKSVAKQLAGECRVLCFDEFFVSDIGDAMLLGGFLEALFDEGVVMVATSNIAIHDLFQKQLQKVRFEPAIALLQKNMQSIHLDGSNDHRYRHQSGNPYLFSCQPCATRAGI